MQPSGGYLYEPRADEAIARARILHLAEGILMGVRRVAAEDALGELVDVARAAQMSPFTVAEALVSLAGGAVPPSSKSPALALVDQHWGDLMPSPHVVG